MPFSFKSLSIPDVILVEPKIFPDERGYFLETFKASDFNNADIPNQFTQDNFSYSKKNVIRGLHYQKGPNAQGKLAFVIRGRVWDVAVDIRKDSPTFLKWVAMDLDDEKHEMLYIPPGFAHGFVALSDNVCFLYKCTNEYDSLSDTGIRWDDPDIAIPWSVKNPIVSEKDKNLPYFCDTEIS